MLQSTEQSRGYALLAPALLASCVLLLMPLLGILALSITSARDFSGLTGQNFAAIFTLAEPRVAIYGVPMPFENPIYLALIFKSLGMSLAATLTVVLLVYPVAYFLAFHVNPRRQAFWVFLFTLPFLTSYLIRIFSWKIILGFNGLINSSLTGLGYIEAPIETLVYNQFAVILTLAHAWAPFALLPIFVSLRKIDRSLLEASKDLGRGPLSQFLTVTLPLSLPGVVSATVLVFVPTVGDFITPALVGGPDGTMIGSLIHALFTKSDQWNLGAAVAVVMMTTTATVAVLLRWIILRAFAPRAYLA